MKNFFTRERRLFDFPYSIYYDCGEDIIYVGDISSVQLLTKEDGICFQRIGSRRIGKLMNEFNCVYGIWIMDNRLYVSDHGNKRILIFKSIK